MHGHHPSWSLGHIIIASTLEKVLGQMKETILGIAEQRLQNIKICEATVQPPQTQREVMSTKQGCQLPSSAGPASRGQFWTPGRCERLGAGAVASIKDCDLRQVPKCSTLFYDK